MEFVITNSIQIRSVGLVNFDRLHDRADREKSLLLGELNHLGCEPTNATRERAFSEVRSLLAEPMPMTRAGRWLFLLAPPDRARES